MGSDDLVNNSKIEPTKAEEEAIARGLQVIDFFHPFGLYFAHKTGFTLSENSQ